MPSQAAPQVAPFGSVDGREVALYTLASERLRVELLTYGGIIRAVYAPDRDGEVANVALGFSSLEDYLERSPYFGCITGRYANRIRAGRFTLEGVERHLAVNDPPNSLHGGTKGFDKQLWRRPPARGRRALARLRQRRRGGGLSGPLAVRVDYRLDADELRIDYHARNESSAHSTVVNLTNHTYWNLLGEGSGTSSTTSSSSRPRPTRRSTRRHPDRRARVSRRHAARLPHADARWASGSRASRAAPERAAATTTTSSSTAGGRAALRPRACTSPRPVACSRC